MKTATLCLAVALASAGAGSTAMAAGSTHPTKARTHSGAPSIAWALDKVEASDYDMDAMIANDLYIVPDYIAIHRSEVRYLENHAKEAEPAVLKRLTSGRTLTGEYTHPIYMRIIQLSADTRGLRYVANYLDSLPDSHTPTITPSFLIASRIAKHWLHHDPLFAAESEDTVQIYTQRHRVAQKLRQIHGDA